MILRRLTEHVKSQNWFAVGLDFLIVVAGVFVATQVANWNTARVERAQERQYLLRLHEEVSALVDEQERDRADVMARATRMEEIAAYLNVFGTPAASVLEPVGDHCRAVITSHIYAGNITLPPTINELISTGRILLVSNEKLRMQIVRFAQAIDESGQLRHDIQVDRMVMSRKYPDLIQLSPINRDLSACDFPAMAGSQAFRNDYLDNMPRFLAYADAVIQSQQDLRRELHAALDAELSIQHEESAP
ncbi:hypothetical protein [Hyphomonas sp.]|uniref:hypothetical protein n=1 Tax=Hyphomonas sp. TaxID=87 RepID=UPI0025BF9B20|nr:hypothetical protein [Hyphomonas sp.]MBI1398802.1 hypothetical protein [Hyphomonas sp.]